MRVAAVQHDICWEDGGATRRRLEPWIAAAAGAGARLIALSEMFACGFSMRTEHIAEPFDGPSVSFLRDQAARYGVWLAGSVPELPELGAAENAAEGSPAPVRPYNTLVVVGPDGSVKRYRKRHPFTYAGEDRHYRAGDELVVVEVDGLRIGLFVCYDLRFADDFWTLAPSVDAYLVVANWPEVRREHWQVLLRARAIENLAYVVGVNRVGSGGNLRYAGDSRIIGPRGEVLAAASEQETLLFGDLDVGWVARTRAELPFLTDRRPAS